MNPRVAPSVILALLVACGGGTGTGAAVPDAPEYPGALVDLAPGPERWLVEQSVTFERGGRAETSRVAMQRLGEELTLVLLTPLGTRAAVIRERGAELTSVDVAPGGHLPVPPEFVLLDVHRAYFVRAPAPPAGGEGAVTYEREGERVRETWRDGRVTERTFERLDGDPAGVVRIAFEADDARRIPSARLTNEWLGYALTIATDRLQELPSQRTSGGGP